MAINSGLIFIVDAPFSVTHLPRGRSDKSEVRVLTTYWVIVPRQAAAEGGEAERGLGGRWTRTLGPAREFQKAVWTVAASRCYLAGLAFNPNSPVN